MINLLSDQTKNNFKFARLNQKLIPWIIVFSLSIIGLIGIAIYGTSNINSVAKSYQNQIATTESELNSAHINNVKSELASISGNLQLTVNVLSREVLFSKLLQSIASVIPNGVNLTGLTINQDDGAIDIQAKASGYDTATQLQANLVDPNNQIFTKADLVSVNCATVTQDSQDPAHPCTVSITALFGNNKQFLFINEGKSS